MNYLDQFQILVNGIKPGSYSYDFGIDDSFFRSFEFGEIRQGTVDVHVDMEKEEKLIHFHFRIKGIVKVPCDRCDELFDQPIQGEEELIVKFGTDFHEESEVVQVIPETENHFNLSSFIYEYIHLLVPIRRVHPDDENGNSTCDPEVIRRLESSPRPSEPDPRWDILNKLKTKN